MKFNMLMEYTLMDEVPLVFMMRHYGSLQHPKNQDQNFHFITLNNKP